jgi:hypothetical protein
VKSSRKTDTVIADEGQRWNVSPGCLAPGKRRPGHG